MLLRSYKHTILITKEQTVKKSNFIYILYVPVLLYTFYYFFIRKNTISSYTNSIGNKTSVLSENLMSSPYPDTISSI